MKNRCFAPLRVLIFVGVMMAGVTGCSGSSNASSTNVPAVSPDGKSASIHLMFGKSSASLAGPHEASERFAKYLSSSTAALIVTIGPLAGPAEAPQTFPCTTTCSATANAPVGQDAISVALTDGVAGHVLSLVTTTLTVQPNVLNTFALTANPVVDHISFSAAAALSSGAAASIPITFNAYDAAGQLIVGPGSYVDATNTPVAFTLSATSNGAGNGAATLSQTTISAPPTAPLTASYNGGWTTGISIATTVPAAIAAHSVGTFSTSLPVAASEQTFTSGLSGPTSLGGDTVGTDGSIYFTDCAANAIHKITPGSSAPIATFAVPGGVDCPWDITTGPDGNIWFTANGGLHITADGSIVKMTPAGTMTVYTGSGPSDISGSGPFDIVSGPNGNLWFTERWVGNIGEITPSGTITQHSGLTSYNTNGITVGPDGALWFTEGGTGADDGTAYIGSITTGGHVSEWHLPAGQYSPHYIATGPDGNLWFTEFNGASIGKITPAGAMSFYSANLPGNSARGIVAAQDGRMWTVFTNYPGLAAIAMDGTITYYPTASGMSTLGSSIVVGPDGNLWVTQAPTGILKYDF